MSKLIILLVALFGVAYSAPILDVGVAYSDVFQDPIANMTELETIGEFDGKLIFVERTTNTANIEAAKLICDRFRFSLLTLGSRQEFDWLRTHLAANQRYWTSGKDTATYRWELGAGQIVEKATYNVLPWHPTCLILQNDRLIADPCDGSLGHSYFTLCQNFIVGHDAQQ